MVLCSSHTNREDGTREEIRMHERQGGRKGLEETDRHNDLLYLKMIVKIR